MAGALRKDPAIEQFGRMRDNSSQYFRFNKKTGPFLFAVVCLLPLGVGYLSYQTHGQIQLAGLRRDRPFFRQFKQPETEEPASDRQPLRVTVSALAVAVEPCNTRPKAVTAPPSKLT